MRKLPNILTVGRLIAAPFVLLVFALAPRPAADWAALLLFVAAAATDWFDGWLARRYDAGSVFGRMLDPIADKAISMIALAALLGLHGVGFAVAAPVAVIILREVLVAGLREFMAGAPVLSVTPLAKWKTAAQFVAIAALLAVEPAGAFGASAAAAHVGLALLWIAAALTAVTGWDYLSKCMVHIRREESA